MKPTQVAELFANIKNTFVSFFSILMFVALGVGIFVGIAWTSPALQNSADEKFQNYGLHHFQITFPYGLTDEDLAKLKEVEGVSNVEAVSQSFQTYLHEGRETQFKLQGLTSEIDRLEVIEGELPSKVGEIALKASAVDKLGISVGDVISFNSDVSSDANGLSASTEATAADSQAADAQNAGDGSASDVDGDGMKYLKAGSFKVTALVESPEYIAVSSESWGATPSGLSSISCIGWVPEETFDRAAFQNGYPIVNVWCDELDGVNTYSDKYKEESEQQDDRIEELGSTLGRARYDALHSEAKKKIEEGEAQLKEGKEKIAEGEQAITDGTAQLEEGRATLEQKRSEGQAKLAAAYDTLMQGEATRAEGEAKLNEARSKVHKAEEELNEVDTAIADAQASLEDAEKYKATQKKKLDEGKISKRKYNELLDKKGAQLQSSLAAIGKVSKKDIPKIDHTNYDLAIELGSSIIEESDSFEIEYEGETMTLGQARKKLAQGQKELASMEALYNQKVQELNAGWAEYNNGVALLETETANGEAQLAEAEQKLEEVKTQVAEGKAEVAEEEPKLESAKKQYDSMADYGWTVMPRSYNGGSFEIDTFSGVTSRLSWSMAALFIIVGLLVSYSAVSRIVHEQITQIGTKKALGLRAREITISFLLYSALAVIAGAIVGIIVGVTLVEGIIGAALGARFIMGAYPPYFGLPLALAVTALELVLILLATWLACRNILKEHAVELLKGEKPPTAKERFYEKWGIWDKLPLFTQTLVNNCVNDKRRVFSTIVGVAGCTALIVTAITLNNDVLKSYDRHYEDVYGFDTILAFEQDETTEDIDAVAEGLRSGGLDYARVVKRQMGLTYPDESLGTARMLIPVDDGGFGSVMHLNAIEGDPVNLSEDGVWISKAYVEHTGAKPGDDLVVNSGDGTAHRLKIRGVIEFYLTFNQVVMGKDFYESEFETKAQPNSILVHSGEEGEEALQSAVAKAKGVVQVTDDKTSQKKNFNDFSSVSRTVVMIYLALSVLMAVVVLLNLNVMFIEEKKRELIVLMINGFSVKYAKRYIYNDTIVLTIIGIIAGIVLGCIMGAITVTSVEPITASFVKDVDLVAVVVGIVGSAVLAFIMSAIALRRIPRFSLTDINKF